MNQLVHVTVQMATVGTPVKVSIHHIILCECAFKLHTCIAIYLKVIGG